MKSKILFSMFFVTLLCIGCKPDPQVLLLESFNACQQVNQGHYKMEKRMKYMSGKDTTKSIFDCQFMKLDSDSIFPVAFHYRRKIDSFPDSYALYTGQEFVTYYDKDSTGDIRRKSLWAEDIQQYKHNYTFYLPLTSRSSYPLAEDSTKLDENHTFEFIGSQKLNGHPTYHIKMMEYPEVDTSDYIATIKYEIHYWINKKDRIPIQYSVAYDLLMDNDTMYQYEINTLTDYEINKNIDSSKLSLLSIPPYIKMKEYTPYESPELLAVGSVAPKWKVPTLENDTIALADLKGKVVMIDFFYKSCLPCMKALPALQALHEKYSGEDFILLGIDPFDSIEKDEIDTFLEKRGVTYPILLSDPDVPKSYNVSGYPTIYIIDKQGKIAYAHAGYGEDTKDLLEEEILKLL